MKDALYALHDAAVLSLIARCIWLAPAWGQRVLDFLRDYDDYRRSRP